MAYKLSTNTNKKCASDDCNKRAVSVWETTANAEMEWVTCESCQEKDFGGWPDGSDSGKDSLGLCEEIYGQQGLREKNNDGSNETGSPNYIKHTLEPPPDNLKPRYYNSLRNATSDELKLVLGMLKYEDEIFWIIDQVKMGNFDVQWRSGQEPGQLSYKVF